MEQFNSQTHNIINQYYSQTSSIFSIALESDISTQSTVTSQSLSNSSASQIGKDKSLSSGDIQNRKNNVLSNIKYIIDKMTSWIKELILRMKNYSKKIWQSDSKFKEEYNEIKQSRKPMQGVKVLSYYYDNRLLDNAMQKVIAMIKEIFNNAINETIFNNQEYCLLQGKKETEQYIIKNVAGSLTPDGQNKIDNIKALFIFIKQSYRKEKKEVLITPNQIMRLEQGLGETKRSMQVVNGNIEQMKRMQTQLETYVKNKLNIPNGVEHREEYRKIVTNFSTVYSFFINFSHYYYDLKTEYQFCCREKLKRLYQF